MFGKRTRHSIGVRDIFLLDGSRRKKGVRGREFGTVKRFVWLQGRVISLCFVRCIDEDGKNTPITHSVQMKELFYYSNLKRLFVLPIISKQNRLLRLLVHHTTSMQYPETIYQSAWPKTRAKTSCILSPCSNLPSNNPLITQPSNIKLQAAVSSRKAQPFKSTNVWSDIPSYNTTMRFKGSLVKRRRVSLHFVSWRIFGLLDHWFVVEMTTMVDRELRCTSPGIVYAVVDVFVVGLGLLVACTWGVKRTGLTWKADWKTGVGMIKFWNRAQAIDVSGMISRLTVSKSPKQYRCRGLAFFLGLTSRFIWDVYHRIMLCTPSKEETDMLKYLEGKVHPGGRRGSDHPPLNSYAIRVSPDIQGKGTKWTSHQFCEHSLQMGYKWCRRRIDSKTSKNDLCLRSRTKYWLALLIQIPVDLHALNIAVVHLHCDAGSITEQRDRSIDKPNKVLLSGDMSRCLVTASLLESTCISDNRDHNLRRIKHWGSLAVIPAFQLTDDGEDQDMDTA